MDEDNRIDTARRTREDYRSQFPAAEERRTSPERKSDTFVKITLVQTAVCVILMGALLLCRSVAPQSYEKLRAGYLAIMQENVGAKGVWAQLKKSVKELLPQPEETTDGDGVEDSALQGMGASQTDPNEKNMSFSPYYITAAPTVPVDGRISSPFGFREDPFNGEISLHTGLDIATEEGTPIAAAYYGKVAQVGENDVAGKFIRITHSGELETFYCHCSEIIAQQGAVIRQGEIIAKVGHTGQTTGPHLHFEVRIGGKRMNPEWLLGGKMSV